MKFRPLVLATLADGKWHPASEMVPILRHLIRPEVAYRRAVNDAEGEKLSHFEAVSRGTPRVVRIKLDNMKYEGLIQARGLGNTREYRLPQNGQE